MLKKNKWLFGGLVVVGLCGAGWLTNGLPLVVASTFNGTPAAPPQGVYTQVGSRGLIPVDTQLPGGVAPQTVAAGAFQVGAEAFGEMIGNTTTSTAGAATLNTTGGYVTTEALTTAVGATYSFVLTNSQFTATSPQPFVGLYNKSNTGGAIGVTSVTMGSGTATIVFTNNGTTALNGTCILVFHI